MLRLIATNIYIAIHLLLKRNNKHNCALLRAHFFFSEGTNTDLKGNEKLSGAHYMLILNKLVSEIIFIKVALYGYR